MAKIQGQSGAWKDVQSQLIRSNIAAQTTSEVKQILKELEQKRQWQYQAMEREFSSKIQALQNDIQYKQSHLQSQTNILHYQTNEKIQALDAEITKYEINLNSQANSIEQRIEFEQQRLSTCAEQHQAEIDQAITELSSQYENEQVELENQQSQLDTTFQNQLSALQQEKISIQKGFEQQPKALQAINHDISLLENEKTTLIQQGFAAQVRYWLNILIKWQWSQSYKYQLSRLYRDQKHCIEQFNLEYEQAIAQVNAAVEETQKAYDVELQKLESEKQLLTETYQQQHTETQREIKAKQQHLLNSLKQDKMSLLEAYEKNYQRLEQQKAHLKQQTQATISEWQQSIKAAQQQYQALQDNHDEFIQQSCEQLTDNIDNLQRIVNSKPFIGAEAELAVVAQLSRLSDAYYVLNDVHLQHSHYVTCFDKRVISAQIDHLVVASTGVFVIETKYWSQKFVESGDYYNPYEQVHCAAYLCHLYLKEVLGIKTTVRSIVAYWGALPPKDKKYFAQPKRIEEVNGYITYFKQPLLNSLNVERIVGQFSPNEDGL